MVTPSSATQDPELSAALGWPGGISDPMLDRTELLRMVAALMQDKLWEDHRAKHLWDHTQEQVKPVTYSTGGLQLEAGFYSAGQLREMLKALESMNAAARRAMEEMS